MRPVSGPAPADRHASRASLPPADRAAVRVLGQADAEVDGFCPGCTPELTEHGWQHDRSCPFRRRAA